MLFHKIIRIHHHLHSREHAQEIALNRISHMMRWSAFRGICGQRFTTLWALYGLLYTLFHIIICIRHHLYSREHAQEIALSRISHTMMECIPEHLWPAIHDSMSVIWSAIYAFPHNYTYTSPFVPQRACTGDCIESDFAYDAMECIPGHLWPAIHDSMRVIWSARYAFSTQLYVYVTFCATESMQRRLHWVGFCIRCDEVYSGAFVTSDSRLFERYMVCYIRFFHTFIRIRRHLCHREHA